MLMITRRLDEGERRQARREWRRFQMGELKGSRVCVAGLGAIGKAVVRDSRDSRSKQPKSGTLRRREDQPTRCTASTE